ncbi:MAG: hypothetical protein M9955_23360 [Rhizobiaceae bacterium]|nr:hypothetical protein [Rhizobiaceae bacterium]
MAKATITRERRVLLIAGVPPCSNYSGGIFLEQIVRATQPPAGVFVVQNRHLTPILSADLASRLSIRTRIKPEELHDAGDMPVRVRRDERHARLKTVPELFSKALRFAAEINATDFWIVLEGQTLIRLAHMLMTKGGLPVHVQVMDPPGWWLRAHNVDTRSSEEILKQFDEVLRGAAGCAAASWAMASHFRHLYKARCAVVVPALDAQLALPAALSPGDGTMRVAFSGQTYATEEMNDLIGAMVDIKNSGRFRDVELHAFTNHIPTDVPDSTSVIRSRGWISQKDLVRELAKMDLLYCPYWFAEGMRETANLSFPSKLITYFASGRPVVFHGRADSSPGRFLRENAAAFFCFRPGKDAIRNTLERSLIRHDDYAEVSANGRALVESRFSFEALRASFSDFLHIPREDEGGNVRAPWRGHNLADQA